MTGDQATLGGFIVAALVAAAAFLRWAWPPVKGFFGSLDDTFATINGRPARIDKAGREAEPAVPSLTVQLADLKSAVSDQAAQNARLAAIEVTQAEHGNRLDRIEAGGHLERIAGHIDSAQAWRAVEALTQDEDTED